MSGITIGRIANITYLQEYSIRIFGMSENIRFFLAYKLIEAYDQANRN